MRSAWRRFEKARHTGTGLAADRAEGRKGEARRNRDVGPAAWNPYGQAAVRKPVRSNKVTVEKPATDKTGAGAPHLGESA